MSGNLYTRKMEEMYDTIFQQCEELNTELDKLGPLAKQMHLLSSNAVSSAARAGSDGNAFRVLTQDIQLLSDDVSGSINDSQLLIGIVITFASELVTIFSNYMNQINCEHQLENTKNGSSNTFTDTDKQSIIKEIHYHNRKLSQNIGLLTSALDPIGVVVKKGEYLAVFSSVEAANAGQHGESFEAVASMLRELVGRLSQQSKRQQSLLRDLSEAMELQSNQEKLIYKW